MKILVAVGYCPASEAWGLCGGHDRKVERAVADAAPNTPMDDPVHAERMADVAFGPGREIGQGVSCKSSCLAKMQGIGWVDCGGMGLNAEEKILCSCNHVVRKLCCKVYSTAQESEQVLLWIISQPPPPNSSPFPFIPPFLFFSTLTNPPPPSLRR